VIKIIGVLHIEVWGKRSMNHFETLKSYLTELGYDYQVLDEADQILKLDAPDNGIQNLLLDCEDPILILEQFICDLKEPLNALDLRDLLQMNRNLVHGAFVLDESGKKVLFRDTLQILNLDINEIKASIDALALGLAEHANRLVQIAHTSGGR
jgi:tRNA isopentenyl-2-thiomethyl-A-37 hydroxylase MiaE